jgi:hypothetical protein
MAPDLAGVHAKIERAYEHLHALQSEVVTWVERYPYGIRTEVHDEGRLHTATLEVYRRPDSARFGLLIGDCAQNLRSALDHLVFAVASDSLTDERLAEVEDSLAFPICTTLGAWNTALERGRLEGLSEGVRAEIERRQPYHAGNPTEHWLYALHWLNNRDKHRVLHAIAAFPEPAAVEFMPELPGPNEGFVTPPPYQDGTQIVWFRTEQPSPDVQMKCDIIVEIRVRETPLPEDIRELLLKIGQLIQRIVSDVAKAHATT